MNEWIFCLFHWYTHYLIDSLKQMQLCWLLESSKEELKESLEPASPIEELGRCLFILFRFFKVLRTLAKQPSIFFPLATASRCTMAAAGLWLEPTVLELWM